MTEKVLKTLDAVTFHGTAQGTGDSLEDSAATVNVDVGARLREMW
jgi:hypothetical protein